MEDYCNFIQFLLFLVSLAYTAIKKYLQWMCKDSSITSIAFYEMEIMALWGNHIA